MMQPIRATPLSKRRRNPWTEKLVWKSQATNGAKKCRLNNKLTLTVVFRVSAQNLLHGRKEISPVVSQIVVEYSTSVQTDSTGCRGIKWTDSVDVSRVTGTAASGLNNFSGWSFTATDCSWVKLTKVNQGITQRRLRHHSKNYILLEFTLEAKNALHKLPHLSTTSMQKNELVEAKNIWLDENTWFQTTIFTPSNA